MAESFQKFAEYWQELGRILLVFCLNLGSILAEVWKIIKESLQVFARILAESY